MEQDNRRLNAMQADLRMQADLLNEALGIETTRPSQRREIAKKAMARHQDSVALRRLALGVSETCLRPKRPPAGVSDMDRNDPAGSVFIAHELTSALSRSATLTPHRA